MIYITETPEDSKTGSAKYFGKKEIKGLVLKLRGPPESVHKAVCCQDFIRVHKRTTGPVRSSDKAEQMLSRQGDTR